MAVAALASTYLGTVTFTTLAGAGLVEEKKAGALDRANRMFAVQQLAVDALRVLISSTKLGREGLIYPRICTNKH